MGFRAGDDGGTEHTGSVLPVTWADLARLGRAIFDALALAGDAMRKGRP